MFESKLVIFPLVLAIGFLLWLGWKIRRAWQSLKLSFNRRKVSNIFRLLGEERRRRKEKDRRSTRREKVWIRSKFIIKVTKSR